MGRLSARPGRFFAEDIRADLPKGLVLLCGPESLSKEEALRALLEACGVGDTQGKLAVRRSRAGELPASEIAAAGNQAGLFGGGGPEVVIVSEAERLSRGPRSEKESWLSLSETATPNPIVLLSDLGFLDLLRRGSFFRSLLERIKSYEFAYPSPKEAVEWLLAYAQGEGIRLTRGAAWTLVGRLGRDLMTLKQEVVRLSLASGSGTVDERALESRAWAGAAGSSWKLASEVAVGHPEKALAVFHRLRWEAQPGAILWALQTSVSDALAGRYRGFGGRQVDLAPAPVLARMLRRCYEFDRNTKTGHWASATAEVALEALLADEFVALRRLADRKQPARR